MSDMDEDLLLRRARRSIESCRKGSGEVRVLRHGSPVGKDLHITEFTPPSGGQPITGSHLEGRWDEAAQAEYARKFYTLCFGHPAVVGITWWDLCDRGSWLEGGGMLREDLSPKPVFRQLDGLINRRWHTDAEGRTDASGSFRFSGFHGRYEIRVSDGTETVTRRYHLSGRRRYAAVVALQGRGEAGRLHLVGLAWIKGSC